METCRECNRDFDTLESVFRHQRSHSQTAQAYVLKWEHGGVPPLCACGCGQNTVWNVGMKKYTTFLKGHSSKGRTKSEDEKRRIGEKNRVNMTRWMSRHPDVAAKHVEAMNANNQREESRRKRKESVHATYDAMSPEDKQKFSDHAKDLWQDGTLVEARSKAAETFKQRFADGQYDFTERNDKISEAITQRYLDGGFEWSTGQYTSTKTGRTCNYRSSWELELMHQLDSDDTVETWNYEPLSIPYVLEEKTRRYVPDFQVVLSDGTSLLVEVKPPELTSTETNAAKRSAALDFCQKVSWRYAEWKPGVHLHDLSHTYPHDSIVP